jgi:hypothetical protein
MSTNLEIEYKLLTDARSDVKKFDAIYKHLINDVYRFAYSFKIKE